MKVLLMWGVLCFSCQDLLEACRKGLGGAHEWLRTLRHGRARYLVDTAKVKAQWEARLGEHIALREELAGALEEFREVKRFVFSLFFCLLY